MKVEHILLNESKFAVTDVMIKTIHVAVCYGYALDDKIIPRSISRFLRQNNSEKRKLCDL